MRSLPRLAVVLGAIASAVAGAIAIAPAPAQAAVATRPSTGTVEVQFCGSETPGTWTVRASGFTQVVPAIELPFALPDTTVQVRPMATRTSLAQRSLGHGHYRLTSRVRQQAEHGYERANGIPVRLERRIDGHWRRVRGLTLTTVHGQADAIVTSPGRYRAVVHPDGNHGGSTSQPVRLGG